MIKVVLMVVVIFYGGCGDEESNEEFVFYLVGGWKYLMGSDWVVYVF